MTNKLFQQTVRQMSESTGLTVGVVDCQGVVVVCSNPGMNGSVLAGLSIDPPEAGKCIVSGEHTLIGLPGQLTRPDLAVFISGTGETAAMLCGMAAVCLGGVRDVYEEKHDKASFIKSILLDNITPYDIHARAKQLHFEDTQRSLFLIRLTEPSEIPPAEVVASLYPDRTRDFVLDLDETSIVLIRQRRQDTAEEDLFAVARTVEDTLKSELMVQTRIGIGGVAQTTRDLAVAYRNALMAIEVGVVFDPEKSISDYAKLGIGRLIYQMPRELCETFLREVFPDGSIGELDQETMYTIQKFFEYDLNMSETARHLYLHRNTLIYRLERVRRLTGLDMREFDQAVVFKVAAMVAKYLNAR